MAGVLSNNPPKILAWGSGCSWGLVTVGFSCCKALRGAALQGGGLPYLGLADPILMFPPGLAQGPGYGVLFWVKNSCWSWERQFQLSQILFRFKPKLFFPCCLAWWVQWQKRAEVGFKGHAGSGLQMPVGPCGEPAGSICPLGFPSWAAGSCATRLLRPPILEMSCRIISDAFESGQVAVL